MGIRKTKSMAQKKADKMDINIRKFALPNKKDLERKEKNKYWASTPLYALEYQKYMEQRNGQSI